MSGNASRKYKQYMLMQERKKLFGDISARDENGILDLVAFSASHGTIITGKIKYESLKGSSKAKKLKAL